MALKDYYELSAMLRMQLPILLSFAFLRCLMGKVTNFWAKRLVPERLKTAFEPVSLATANTLSSLHALLLMASVWYTALFYSPWHTKNAAQQLNTSLVCAEYDNTRVQGLSCASGLLALFTSSDPFTLGLALATFKAVADGSIMAMALSMLTWRASVAMHDTSPVIFFGVLFACTTSYSSWCYTDLKNQYRSHGTTIAASFALLLIVSRASMAGARRVWRGLMRCFSTALKWTTPAITHAKRLILRRATGHTD